MRAKLTDDEFIALWKELGSPTLMAKVAKVNVRNVHARRSAIQHRYGITLPVTNDLSPRRVVIKHNEGRVDLDISDGVVIVFSDPHYLPDIRWTTQRALVAMIRQLSPVAVINDGDAFDGGSISRYPRIGWDDKPTVLEELNAVKLNLDEVEQACDDVGCKTKIWNLGNHDARFETRLAAMVPQYEGVSGFKLSDHFPNWQNAWTTWINGDTCITHFYHSGIHATHNNLLKGQCHYVTGHTHSAQVRAWTNAKGETVWAMDCGSVADALGPHNLDYQQGRHGNHRSAFGVLTYRNGRLLQPELVLKYDEDTVEFRGHLLDADTLEVK